MKIKLMIVIVTPVILWICLELIYAASCSPGIFLVSSYGGYRSRMLRPYEVVHVVEKNSATYYLVKGSRWALFTVAGSGGPGYVFDEHGRLVEWTPDINDRFQKKWGYGYFEVERQIDISTLDSILLKNQRKQNPDDRKAPEPFAVEQNGIAAEPASDPHAISDEGPFQASRYWLIPNLGMELLPVAAGSFQMGSDDGEDYEKPRHEVQISRGYWMGKTEVTQGQWQAIVDNNPSSFKGDSLPVEQVSWGDAMMFCAKLTERERRGGRLPAGYVYRLPTEAEWEYAARGGDKSRGYTYSGSNDLGEVGWFGFTRDGNTHPVGQKKPNELGLYDMSGNVWEWCHDECGIYPYANMTNPYDSRSGSCRVCRGGSWYSGAVTCRVAFRGSFARSYSFSGLGFRIVLAPPISREGAYTRPLNGAWPGVLKTGGF